MTTVSHLASVYASAKIVLWVEDPLTRTYLNRIWGDPPEIALAVAWKGTAIAPLIESAIRDGVTNVYGLIDRDFATSNFASWAAKATRQFRMPRHEIENYLLDERAIAECSLNTRGRSRSDVEAELFRFASSQPTWLACRSVLNRMERDIHSGFPSHPPVSVATLEAARVHICESAWYLAMPPTVQNWHPTQQVISALTSAEAAFQTNLADGT